MTFLSAYLLCGAVWGFCNLFLSSVGRTMILTMEPKYMKYMLAGAALGLLVWPLGIVPYLHRPTLIWLAKKTGHISDDEPPP